jgi:dihydroorotate dehydrogenase (fumarate)
VVIGSLFEEKIQNETLLLDEELGMYDDKHPEHADMMPTLRHSGPRRHVYWVKRAVDELGIPVIASLNAITLSTWTEYSKLLAETGVAGLELNLYSPVTDPGIDPRTIENDHIRVLERVRQSVDVPISAKIGYFYTNPLSVIRSMDGTADGFVLFNRFMQPSINVETLRTEYGYAPSGPEDHKIPLRYTGLASGLVGSDICASGGVHSSEDAARMILAGASAVQTVSSLFQNGVGHLSNMIEGLNGWMDRKGFSTIAEMKGRVAKGRNSDPDAYTRAQYVQVLKTVPMAQR